MIKEIVKAKLEGCGKKLRRDDYLELRVCGRWDDAEDDLFLCPICKATLTGMETIIKESLSFLRMIRAKVISNDYIKKDVQERITDLKDALKLIKEAK